jgi:flagellar hook-associated protein 3 FlgL
VAQRLDELLDYANTTDSNGDYLYAGGQSRTKPFSLGNNVTHYAGDDQARLLQVGPERKVVTADNGIDVFMRIRDGNGDFNVSAAAGNTGTGVISNGSVKDHGLLTGDSYAIQFTSATTYDVVNTGSGAAVISGATYVPDDSILFDGMEVSINGTPAAGDSFAIAPSANQDLFATVRDFMQALQSNPANPAEQAKFRQDMNNVMSNLDQALDHLLARRSEVGTRLSYIDSSREENSAIQFQMDKTLAEIEGLDLAEAISQLQYQMTAMQALQQTFSRMEGLSLFNYLR